MARIEHVALFAADWSYGLIYAVHLQATGASYTGSLERFVSDEAIDPVRAYDLSKEAVVIWTKAMVEELRPHGIRINAVSPAAVATPILGDFMEAFGERQLPLQVAVMGCVVNGPGEAREADIGIAAGNKRGHLFVKGRNIAVVPEDEMVDALVEWAEFINEHGTDAAIAKADTAVAEREAARDRSALLDAPGDDANLAGEKIVEIRRKIAG